MQKAFIIVLSGWLAMAMAAAAPRYEQDIIPLLRSSCAGCHNDRDAEGGLSVETFAALRRGGETAGDPVAPGNVDASVMMERIRSTGSDHMPPEDEPQLSAAAIATLEAWIAAGAPGPVEDRSILKTLAVPKLRPYPGRQPVTAMAIAAGGGRVAVARGRGLETVPTAASGDLVWSAATPLTDLPGKVTAVHFSGDGDHLVVAGGVPGLRGVAELRAAATGAIVLRFEGHGDLLSDAELSPDGTLLATAGYDMAVKVWRVADGSLAWENTVHNGAVFDLAWHPSGKLLASASGDETVKLWRANDGVRLDTLSQPQGEVLRVVFSPDGRLVIAAGRDRRIHAWRLVSLEEPAINPVLHSRFAHEAPITTFAVSADGRHLISSAEDRTLTGWRLPDLLIEHVYPRQSDVVSAIDPVGDSLLIGRMDGSLESIAITCDPASPDGRQPQIAEAPSSRSSVSASAVGSAAVTERESNDDPVAAEPVSWPTEITGTIGRTGDVDCFRIRADRGAPLLIDVRAGRSKSQLDSKVEVLDANGRPIERARLQAVRDSWFTFRGKNSTQANDFRLQNWMEMELDEYLYAGGEVVRLWLYPRGPDSGFDVYPGFGNRHTFFGTTAVAHALGEPAWIVRPLPPGSDPVPNGLPVFPVYWENDDEPQRRHGTDSQLIFVPPADGDYVVRLGDTRGFGSADRPQDYHYTLTIRPPRPSFRITVGGKSPQVSPGSGRELSFTAERIEGYDGPIRIAIEDLPAGFTFHGPIEIAAGEFRALGVLSAATDAVDPDATADKAVRVVATAVPEASALEVVDPLQLTGDLGDIKLAAAPKVTVSIEPAADHSFVTQTPGEPLEFRIRQGETITALARAVRHGFDDRIQMGRDSEAGRNIPFGVYVDNIGLSGLLIVEGQTEREFFITASPMARPGRRPLHLKTDVDGGQCTPPVVLNVLPK